MDLQIRKKISSLLWEYFPKFQATRKLKRNGFSIDWNNPKDLNEKIQWLLYNTDISEWTRLADKFLVRDFVKERGLEDILVPLYGRWYDAEDINYDSLPEKFVLKCNHDCGSYHIIDKTAGFNKIEINKDLNERLRYRWGETNGEIHYKKIEPCIIAEKYLESSDYSFSTSLVDYKVWCFNGNPYCIFVGYGRTKDSLYINVYDLDWNVHPEYSVFDNHFRNGNGLVPRPKSLEEMIEDAKILSKGFPEVRVDFYDIDGKLYFGEMTFTSGQGMMPYFTKKYLLEMGNQILLPKK